MSSWLCSYTISVLLFETNVIYLLVSFQWLSFLNSNIFDYGPYDT